jgi:tetratricopeptide (TPR) repeat protein
VEALQAGRCREAAQAFDALAEAPGLDPGRRTDMLYWSAKAHELGGEWGAAQARAGRLAQQTPDAWHAPHAALLMGESLFLQGDYGAARRWLSQALSSDRPGVRTRARGLLRQLDEAAASQ